MSKYVDTGYAESGYFYSSDLYVDGGYCDSGYVDGDGYVVLSGASSPSTKAAKKKKLKNYVINGIKYRWTERQFEEYLNQPEIKEPKKSINTQESQDSEDIEIEILEIDPIEETIEIFIDPFEELAALLRHDDFVRDAGISAQIAVLNHQQYLREQDDIAAMLMLDLL